MEGQSNAEIIESEGYLNSNLVVKVNPGLPEHGQEWPRPKNYNEAKTTKRPKASEKRPPIAGPGAPLPPVPCKFYFLFYYKELTFTM